MKVFKIDGLRQPVRQQFRKLKLDLRKLTLIAKAMLNPSDIGKAIVITGSGRSGTTWLAEILSTAHNCSLMFEPDHPKKCPEAMSSDLRAWKFFDPTAEHTQLKIFMHQALAGNVVNDYTADWADHNLVRLWKTRYWVVKFIFSNNLLPWIVRHIALERKPIHIYRHPGAIFASWKLLDWMDKEKWKLPDPNQLSQWWTAIPGLPDYQSVEVSQPSVARYFTLTWVMENYLPLTQSYAGQWRILSYEKLANSPETEFRRLFAELNLTPPNDLSKRLTTQSRSSWNSSKRREAATTAWRNELTPAEISEIEAVIEVCGLASFFS